MTFEEMSQHMLENSTKVPNRVTVGKYARELGYKVYKPMVNCKIMHYYVNDKIENA
jgi:hypothetical protein